MCSTLSVGEILTHFDHKFIRLSAVDNVSFFVWKYLY